MSGTIKFFLKAIKLNLLLITLLNIHFCAAKSFNFTIQLIHRDSPESPLYPGNLSFHEKIQRYIKYSEARASYFMSSIAGYNSSTMHPTTVNPEVMRYWNTYMVKIGIGNPVQEYWFLLDTGNGLTWIQCQPCKTCYKQDDPIFDPKNSKSYVKVSCSDNSPCNKGRPCIDGGCAYSLFYGHGSESKGVISQETFTLTSHAKETFSLNVTFGCSDYSVGVYDSKIAGILGMDLDPESFMSQYARDTIDQFSYCLVDTATDPSAVSYLKFGNDMYLGRRDEFKMTPFLRHPNNYHYYVILEDISINGTRLNMSKDAFAFKPNGQGGCIIDSGSTYTLIELQAFVSVVLGLDEYFDRFSIKRLHECPNEGLANLVCYEFPPGFTSLPSMTYHFAGGADLHVPPNYAFIIHPGDSYVVATATSVTGMTIIGTLQTPNIRFVYDNEDHKLAFSPEKCEQDRG